MRDPAPADVQASAALPLISITDAVPPEAPDTLLPFFTVAIGASAGGVDALQRLFGAMPKDTGCAFVVVMHLDPERSSMLAALVGRMCAMPVNQATHGMSIAANRVYVVPPGQYIEIHQGRLDLHPIRHRPPRPKTVDQFMVSLAQDQRERAIGIVLTGTDGDGSIGIKAIKSEGGMTIAQTPESAAHSGMPSSAVATGMIDSQLPIEQIPRALTTYVAHAGPAAEPERDAEAGREQQLMEVLAQVRAARGLDFRGYKIPMLLRRVRRRMAINRIGAMPAYLELLRASQDEAAALAADLLIGVTEFFREPEAWAALAEQIVPQVLARKTAGDALRAWVPGCATGEEAYSLAMVLMEHPRVADLGLRLQIFATDVDRRALETGRAGHYPPTIDHAVPAQRLRQFFAHADGGYVVKKELREAVLFAPHNLVSDPPFSHLDIVSCRNLLIYMTPELQRQVLRGFHFALGTDGILFLGKSETVGALAPHFAPATPAARIYRRVGAARFTPLQLASRGVMPRAGGAAGEAARHGGTDYGGLIRDALLQHRAVGAMLTDRHGHALYLYGPVQAYLEQPEGAPTSDLFAMLREELRANARAVLHKAHHERRRAETTTVMTAPDGSERPVRIVAAPAGSGAEDLVLLTFERPEPDARAPPPPSGDEAQALRALEDDLRNTRRELRGAIEELEAANEELRVSNEEAMSVNEELQSSNEELETSKEELQSVNEELTSVNSELQEKVLELERSNNDLGNLLSSTHIPTLFLDRDLRIKRFTPAATRLFSLIASDVDRPLSDITGQGDMRSLLDDARSVLADLAPVQRRDRTAAGHSYLRRTMPYRTRDDRIEGVVVTFTDITELENAAQALRRLAAVMESSSDAVIVHDLDGNVLAWNRGAQALYGYGVEQAVGAPITTLLPDEAGASHAEQVQRLLRGQGVQGAESRRRTLDGRVIDVSSTMSIITGDDGKPGGVALIERDITHRKHAERELQASELRFRTLADSAPVLVWMTDPDGRIEFANRECADVLGLPPATLRGRRWTELLHPDDAQRVQAERPAGPDGRLQVTARALVHGGPPRWMKIVVSPRAAADAAAGSGWIGSMIDIHEQIAAEEALRAADQRKDEFLAMLGHELRNPLAPIRNAAEVLQRVMGDDTRVAWVRDTLVRQVEHVTRLVDDLLDISRITRGSIKLRREPVDLGYAVSRAVDAVRPLIERKRHRLNAQLPEQPLWVEGDAIRLTQVFENLLTNAAKYTDEGGEIGVDVSRGDGHAVIHVRDNGMGISPQMRSRVFDLFVQDERSVDRSQGGLGIGLALVRHLVMLHGGVVEAGSGKGGRGSDFMVRLPVLAGERPPQPQRESPAGDAAGGCIMIVDDDAESAESLSMVLRLGGFDVERAHDLESALELAARIRPHVVLMDLAMPVNDGFEVARRLRALPHMAGAHYVALTGFGHAETIARTRQAGFEHHFVKPVDPVELEEVLRRLVGRKKAAG